VYWGGYYLNDIGKKGVKVEEMMMRLICNVVRINTTKWILLQREEKVVIDNVLLVIWNYDNVSGVIEDNPLKVMLSCVMEKMVNIFRQLFS
jgi:hypothetical protein